MSSPKNNVSPATEYQVQFFDPKKASYIMNNCYINAYVNSKYGVFKKLKLHLVIGSLGLNGWFEYGGVDWKIDDFKNNIKDNHCWLEDESGNVYDYIFPQYNIISLSKTGKKLRLAGLIEGVPKHLLSSAGFDYVPADQESRCMLFLKNKHYMDAIKKYFE